MNKPSWISPNEVYTVVINIVYQLLVKNNKGEERGVKREGGLLTFCPSKLGGGGLSERGSLFERGDLTEDLWYAYPLDGDLSGE